MATFRRRMGKWEVRVKDIITKKFQKLLPIYKNYIPFLN
jgi:hypothetical protein